MTKRKGSKAIKLAARVVDKTAGRVLRHGAREAGKIGLGVIEGFVGIFAPRVPRDRRNGRRLY